MKQLKRITAWVSLLCVLATSLIILPGCSDAPADKKADTTAPSAESTVSEELTTEETKRWLDNLPEKMDFGGETIRFIVEEGSNGELSKRSVWTEEDSADVVDAAIYERNMAVEERLGLKIELVDSIMFAGLPAIVTQSITAGSDDYDIVGTYQYYGIKMALDGLFMNLARLDTFDFSQNYWATEYIDNMSYKGAKYWATGDLALRYIGGMYVTYVNQRIWLDNFGDTSIYQLVRDGQWTLDKLFQLSETVYNDLNGNGKIDKDDLLGWIINIQDPIDGMASGSMIKCSEINADGVPEIRLNNERTYTFYEKLYKLVYEGKGSFVSASDDSVTSMTMFANCNVFATVNKLYQAEIYLREMTDDYYIVPVPKLDEAQERYNTMLHDGVTLFGIPVTNKKVEATSSMLEALAAESHRVVAPAYYDVALKIKYSRDPESAEMIDLIHDNVSSDFAGLYSNSLSDIIHFFRNQLSSKKTDISSVVAKNEKVWTKTLEKVLSKLEENAGQ